MIFHRQNYEKHKKIAKWSKSLTSNYSIVLLVLIISKFSSQNNFFNFKKKQNFSRKSELSVVLIACIFLIPNLISL